MSEKQTPSEQRANEFSSTRRGVLVGATALGAATALPGGHFATSTGDVYPDPWVQTEDERDSIPISETHGPRHWLGRDFWGNRLQDWQVNGGRIECLRGKEGYELRTVGILTRELVASSGPGHLRVRTGIIDGADEGGFAGFLIGVGNGDLDYRAAALAQRSSGRGGGLLCTYETDGRVRFREHTDEENPVAYAELSPDGTHKPSTASNPARNKDVRLSLDILPVVGDRFAIVLKALDPDSGDLLSGAVRVGVRERDLIGGISLVSSPYPRQDGTRWWFDELETAGPKVGVYPDRGFGPIAGTLYSVNKSVMKLSVQLLPIGETDPETIRLRYRPTGSTGSWQTERTTLGPGYTAIFRIENWNSTQARDYQIVYRDAANNKWRYDGQINRDPGGVDELTIGLVNCTIAGGRPLDSTRPLSAYANPSLPGRYTPGNIYIPYTALTRNLATQNPDLLVFAGDQFYEWNPTDVENYSDPNLDYLYKWYLWVWSFRGLTRDTPTVVLVDDHDVYQKNLFGAGRTGLSSTDWNEGGYRGTSEFVNRAQRIQTGHNPDPYDPTPTDPGISVYYGAFTYGGTKFAILEDRKFKVGPDVTRSEVREPLLLGDRQERFLAEWADQQADTAPAVCLTQTVLASAQTTANGRPRMDPDTNGFPKLGRDRAIDLLREAGALVLSGDQHLATLIRHGIEEHTDGVVQFTGPAGGALFPRWFKPADTLPNRRTSPYTGDFTDGFGNKFRMLAVANPNIEFGEFQQAYSGSYIYDRRFRSEGYGIIRVDHDEEAFIIECWPWDVDPAAADAEQFPGWPYKLPFGEANGGE